MGNTPLVKLGKCLPEGVKAARVLAKLEMCNPGGSLKDRIALQVLPSHRHHTHRRRHLPHRRRPLRHPHLHLHHLHPMLQMIEKAEKEGLITPGKTTLVDFTSGNTGTF